MLYFCKGTKNKGQKTRKNMQLFILTLPRENNKETQQIKLILEYRNNHLHI